MDVEKEFRRGQIIIASAMCTMRLHDMGLSMVDAKTALRVGLFMMEELYRHHPGDTTPRSYDDLANLAKEISPVIMKMIEEELEQK